MCVSEFGKLRSQMKKLKVFFILLTSLFVGSAWAQTCDSVSVSGPIGDAPASWVLDDQLIGAGIELAQNTLKAAGVNNVKIVRYASWAEALAATRSGELDMIISAGWSLDRSRYLSYVYPSYAYQFLYVVVRRGETFALNQYADLKGRRGVAGTGLTFGNSAFGLFADNELQLARSPSLGESFRRLLNGEVDFILAYQDAVYSEIYRRDLGDKVQILSTYPFRIDTFFAFSKRSKCASVLMDKVGAEIKKASKTNQYFLFMNKYRTIFNETQSAPAVPFAPPPATPAAATPAAATPPAATPAAAAPPAATPPAK